MIAKLIGGIPAAYLWIALGACIGAWSLYVDHRGYKRAEAACTSEKVEAIQRAITQAQEIAKQDAEIVRNNVQTVEVIKNRTRTIRIKEKNHATANPLPAECVLDDQRVRNINAALSNKDADTPKPDDRLPAASKTGK